MSQTKATLSKFNDLIKHSGELSGVLGFVFGFMLTVILTAHTNSIVVFLIGSFSTIAFLTIFLIKWCQGYFIEGVKA